MSLGSKLRPFLKCLFSLAKGYFSLTASTKPPQNQNQAINGQQQQGNQANVPNNSNVQVPQGLGQLTQELENISVYVLLIVGLYYIRSDISDYF